MQLKPASILFILACCTSALGPIPPEHIRRKHDAEERKRQEAGDYSIPEFPKPTGEFFSFTQPWNTVGCRYLDADIENGYVCDSSSPSGEFFRNKDGVACRFHLFNKSWGYSCEPDTLTLLGDLPESMPRLLCDEYYKAECWPSGLAYNGAGHHEDRDDYWDSEEFARPPEGQDEERDGDRRLILGEIRVSVGELPEDIDESDFLPLGEVFGDETLQIPLFGPFVDRTVEDEDL